MKTFRMEKLAGFMRLAENLDLSIGNDTAFNVSVKRDGQSVETVLKPKSSMSVDSDGRLEMSWTDATGQTSSTVVGSLKLKSFLKKDGTKGVATLSQLSNQLTPSGAAPQSAGASPAKPKAKSSPAKPLVINHVAGTKLQEGDYTYKVDDPSSEFTWIEKGGKSGTFKLRAVGVTKWNQAVTRLNNPKLTTVIPDPPAPTTAPAPPAAAATTSSGGITTQTVVSDQVVKNVAKVLTDVYGGATYAGRTVFRNEMGMVREMINYLNGVGQQLGVSLNSAETLAQIITGPIRPGLGTFAKANLDGVPERTMEKQYRQELNAIMTAVKSLFDRIGKKAGLGKLLNYNSNLKEEYTKSLNKNNSGAAAPSTTPAPVTPAPAASADDGHSKGASLNKKFIKAATLRRLKIRSQMEAAIDSSAQMGRARVY